jgi:hypothetical protein
MTSVGYGDGADRLIVNDLGIGRLAFPHDLRRPHRCACYVRYEISLLQIGPLR